MFTFASFIFKYIISVVIYICQHNPCFMFEYSLKQGTQIYNVINSGTFANNEIPIQRRVIGLFAPHLLFFAITFTERFNQFISILELGVVYFLAVFEHLHRSFFDAVTFLIQNS